VTAAANTPDHKLLERTLDAIPYVQGTRGRPKHKPDKLHADKGYDYPDCHFLLEVLNIKDRIARKGIEPRDKLGRYRWVVERTLSWLNRNRRLKVRYEVRGDITQAFLSIACALLCFHKIESELC
jgi:hypothetical protein